jgi:hypothetical protein
MVDCGSPSNPRKPCFDRLPARTAQLLSQRPDEFGRFGMFGGRFVAETLMP